MSSLTEARIRQRPPVTPAPAPRGLVQRQCACGGKAGIKGECEECRKKRLTVQRQPAAGGGSSGVSNVAPPIVHEVLRSPGRPLEASPGGECPACRKKKKLRRSPTGSAPAAVPPIVHEVLRSPGEPLAEATRSDMETHLGHDFRQVRVHQGPRAAESARAVQAQAYTVGSDIVFAAGRRASPDRQGRELLAHELTHVLQQRDATSSGALVLDDPQGPAEREAERAAQSVRSGAIPELRNMAGRRRLQRLPFDGGSEDPLHQPSLAPPSLPPPCQVITTSESQENLNEALCLTSESQERNPACTLTREQRSMLTAATKKAAERVNWAHALITSGADGREYAEELADRLFSSDPPSFEEILRTLESMQGYLQGSGPRYAGRTCGDEECYKANAYVTGAGQLPVFICPQAFLRGKERLVNTVIHEVVHLTGIDVDDSTPLEGYCTGSDCQTPCLTREDADGWAHYISCLGKSLRIPETLLLLGQILKDL